MSTEGRREEKRRLLCRTVVSRTLPNTVSEFSEGPLPDPKTLRVYRRDGSVISAIGTLYADFTLMFLARKVSEWASLPVLAKAQGEGRDAGKLRVILHIDVGLNQ